MKDVKIPLYHKACLTIDEAVEYSNIGINTLRKEMKKPNCPFVLHVGNRKIIKRKAFEEFLNNIEEIEL